MREWQRTRDLSVRAFVIGEPGSGKTSRVAAWVRALARATFYNEPVFDSVFVFDRLRETLWDNEHRVASIEEYHQLTEDMWWQHAAEDPDGYGRMIPRIVVWRLGPDVEPYALALREGIDQGNVLFVFVEAADWFPSNLLSWPVDKVRDDGIRLQHLIRMGRHIPNICGMLSPCHFITETQYAKDVSPLVRNAANYVATGCLEGETNLEWIRRNMGEGKTTAEAVSRLEKHQWLELRNKVHRSIPSFPLSLSKGEL